MKIAMFGGTFDPMHSGHLALGTHFADLLDLDRVFVVPARTPPHKLASRTPGEVRLEMCHLAVGEDQRFVALDIELLRDSTSYTYVTVTQLLEDYRGSEFYLITGADMFMTLDNWYRFDDLKQLVTFCTVPRDNIGMDQLLERAGYLESIGCRTFVTDWRPIPISSTLIRSRAAQGLSLEGLVPPAVEEYIIANGLYRNEKQDGRCENIDF